MGLIRTPWTRQPRVAVPVNRQNKFGVHVIGGHCGTVLIGGPLSDNKQGVVNGRMCLLSNGTNTRTIRPPDSRVVKSIVIGISSLSFALDDYQNYATNGSYLFVSNVAPNKDKALLRTVSGGDKYGTVAGLFTIQSTRYCVAASTSTVDSRTYRDGVLWDTLGAGTSFGNATSLALTTNALGTTAVDYTYFLDVDLESSGLSNYLMDLDRNPWQIFAPLSRNIWAGPSAGASIYTLSNATYAPGSITATGVTPRVDVAVA